MLSGGEKPRKADWDQIQKNLKRQAKLFGGSKEVLEDFKVGMSDLGSSGNSEQDELGGKEIISETSKNNLECR